MVTSRPSSRRFSATSRPMKPPPTMTADLGLFRSTNALIRRVSSTVRRVKSLSLSIPGRFGHTGFAPGDRRSLS